MYPRISDMIFDLTGWYIPMPIQTFGFFMALGFLAGGIIIYRGLKKLVNEGTISGVIEKRMVGKPASPLEILWNAFIGFLLGYKIFAMLLNWSTFVDNPQAFLVSSEGSWVGAFLGAVLLGILKYYEKKSELLAKPKIVEETIYPHERVGDLIGLAAISGILGAKIFTWIEDWEGFLQDPMGALLSFSGLTFYGGLICGSIAILWYLRAKKIPLLYFLDIVGPALILAYGIGRLGCHFSGDGDWGIINTLTRPDWLAFLPDWAWAYDYPNNVADRGILIEGCQARHCYKLADPVFPTSVYEFVMSLGIFGVLIMLAKKLRIPGIIFAIYLILNGLERFLIESIRVNDQYDVMGFELSQAQIIAIGLMLTGIILAFVMRAYHQKKQMV